MLESVYLSWLICSSFSLCLSLLMMIRILFSSSLRTKIFHQLMCLLGLSDLFISLSLSFGNKNHNSYLLCSLQEYLLQCGLLYRALMTVILCYFSGIILSSLSFPQLNHIQGIVMICLTCFIVILSCSIYFQTADNFCFQNTYQEDEIKYSVIVLFPIYCCVLIDILLYLFSRFNVRKLFITSNDLSHEKKLLEIANQFLRYPIVTGVLLLPDVSYAIYLYLTGHQNVYFAIISSCSMALTGGAIAVRYILQHDSGLFALSSVLYSYQTDQLLNWTVNFTSSINFSFRKKENPSTPRSPQRETDKNPRGRYPVDSSTLSDVSHVTGTTDHSTHDSRPFSTKSRFPPLSPLFSVSHDHSEDGPPPLLSLSQKLSSSSSRPGSVTLHRSTDSRTLSEKGKDSHPRPNPPSQRWSQRWSQRYFPSKFSFSNFFGGNEFTHSRTVSNATEVNDTFPQNTQTQLNPIHPSHHNSTGHTHTLTLTESDFL